MNGTCSALDGLDLVLKKCACARGFAYLHVSRLDEGAAEAPKQHLSGALAVLHELRSGDSSASSKVVQVDVEDRRDVKCSQGTVQSAAARAWRHAAQGAIFRDVDAGSGEPRERLLQGEELRGGPGDREEEEATAQGELRRRQAQVNHT